MNALAKFVTERIYLAWTLALCVILLCTLGTGEFMRQQRETERLTQLATEAERLGIELMSLTLNGNLMGSVALLGLIDAEVKREALGKLPANNAKVLDVLESVGRSYDADGVFVVARNGIITSSWDNAGKPSTNLNVKFRPYYQMAMQGMDNIYAAVSLARGDRSLYFSSPVFSENTSGTEAIGAVVARTGMLKLDNLLRDRADHALLLSPQGVVFASTRKEWIGHLSGKATPERLKAIRDLKQFGNMFAKDDPALLPFASQQGVQDYDGHRHLVTVAKVQWNDPFGDWQVVLMEDLARTLPLSQRIGIMVGMAIFLLVVSVLLLSVLRGHHAQVTTARQLDVLARQQQAYAERKAAVADAALRLQQAKTLEALGQTYLSELHALLDILQGALYVVGDGEGMNLFASYACAVPPAPTFRLGDGLLGQCAVEKRLLRLDAPDDEGFWRIRSGLGGSAPRSLLMAPILLNDSLLGATEVALMSLADTDTEEVLAEMNKLLALNVEILRRSARTEAMLESTVEAGRASAERAHFQQVLIDTIPYPVFYKGADTRFIGFNQAYETTFGVQRSDLVGKCVLDLDYLPEADRRAYQTEDEATIAACGTLQREMQIPFADGKLHDTLYYVSGFRNADGSPGGLVGTFIDITAQKEAQKNIEKLADAERFNRLSQGREARILQLKAEVNELCQRLAEPPRYASVQTQTRADATPTWEADLPIGEHLKLVQLNWHSAYECGQADIDCEHHVLFAIANELINAVVAGHSPEAIQHIIDQLVQETVQHFAHEEAILREQGYPALDEHAAIHKALVDQAVHLIGEFKAGRAESGPFFQFLAYDVIARHMLGEDRKFFPLFQSAAVQTASASSSTVPPLAELVDLDELQTLFSAFCESVGIAAAIIDLQANVLASSRWQRACTDFHRVNPESCALCIESDTGLALQLQEGKDFTMYRCKNGMTDCASPIIVEGHHLANVFIGQFHLGPPDLEFFRQQARQYGYDEADYLKAVQEAPVADEKRLPVILGFLSGFARMVSTMSLARHRADAAQQRLQQQAEELQRERIAALSLAEDAEQTRIALEYVSKEKQA